VPLDAFLYRRVVESVWTRYRQECRFGRRCWPAAGLPELAAPEAERPDGALLERLEAILQTLDEGELRLIRQLFWDGRSEDDLARELGVTRQAVNKRKQKLLRRLGSDLMLEGVA
jgi:DNA-directed RNA polymerase specialized sigma24 family protein